MFCSSGYFLIHCPYLKISCNLKQTFFFDLSYCKFCLPDVSHLCEACPNLRELDLSDSTALTCQAVTVIANRLKQLEYLAISRCYHILGITIL